MSIAKAESLQAPLIPMKAQQDLVISQGVGRPQPFDTGRDDAAALNAVLRVPTASAGTMCTGGDSA